MDKSEVGQNRLGNAHVHFSYSGTNLRQAKCWRWSPFIRPSPRERGAAVIKLIPLIALLALAFVISRRGDDTRNVDLNDGTTPSSQSPFEEVAERIQAARNGVPTGTPLKPIDEDFLTGYEQTGLAVALVLAIGLGTWKLTPVLGAFLIKRYDPWLSIGYDLKFALAQEQTVAQYASELQVVSRTQSEMERSREQILSEFFQEAKARFKNLRKLYAEISPSLEQDERQKILGQLGVEITSLKMRIGALELTAAWLLASVLEKLITQLYERPANITPSTLRTVAGALIMLKDLCAFGVRADLASNPPPRFLAVDDDPISRRAVSMSLKRVCQLPDLAEKGETALELAALHAYDAIFLDVEMPGVDGFEVCTRLHQLPTNRTTAVVFVTGHSDFDSRVKSTSSGGRDLIAKPFLSSEVTLKALTLLLRGRLDRDKAGQKIQKKDSAPAASKRSLPTQPEKKAAANSTALGPVEPLSALSGRNGSGDPSSGAHPVSPTSGPGDSGAFAAYAREHLSEMQEQVSALKLSTDSGKRREILSDLYFGINIFRSEAARVGLRATCQLASALAKLVAKLLDRPVLTPPSAVHAIAEAVLLLEELSPRDVGPDLSDPPIRVMVVDDDPVSRRAISNALQLIFGKPDNAENGEAAVALAESKIFDVIFLDILMPDMDGFDTCSKIRKTRSNGATPVVFVSGQNDAESKEKSLQCGGNGFISKPVLPAEIYLTALTFSLRARVDKGKAAPSVTEPAAEVVC